MRYTVFLIYIVVMVQFINSKRKTVKEDGTNGTHRGYYFYRRSAIINIVLGTAGMVAVSFLLRDNNIIPQAQVFVWIALAGFMLMMFYGAYCMYKMVTSTIAEKKDFVGCMRVMCRFMQI